MGVEDADAQQKNDGVLTWLGKIPGVREAALAGGVLLAEPVLDNLGDAAQVRAAEIAPDALWQTGMNEMFQAADTEASEVLTYFLQTSDGKTRWVKPLTGTVSNIPRAWVEQHFQKERREIEELAAQKSVEVCDIHSHGKETTSAIVNLILKLGPAARREVFEIAQTIDLKKRLSAPPSSTDISSIFGPSPVVAIVNRVNGGATQRKDAVVDPVFVSYYQLFESPAAARSFKEALNVSPASNNRYSPNFAILLAQLKWLQYVNASEEPPQKILSSPQYNELRYSYASANVHLRLTDRASVGKEPPCAGARYSN